MGPQGFVSTFRLFTFLLILQKPEYPISEIDNFDL